jgi:hypothetical protein
MSNSSKMKTALEALVVRAVLAEFAGVQKVVLVSFSSAALVRLR